MRSAIVTVWCDTCQAQECAYCRHTGQHHPECVHTPAQSSQIMSERHTFGPCAERSIAHTHCLTCGSTSVCHNRADCAWFAIQREKPDASPAQSPATCSGDPATCRALPSSAHWSAAMGETPADAVTRTVRPMVVGGVAR